MGNRTQQTSTSPPITSGAFGYDADDRLTTDVYDANGNTINSGGQGITYDFENHILTENGATYLYDGDGNRVQKTVAGLNTLYTIVSVNPTGYPQVAYEQYSGSGTHDNYRAWALGLEREAQYDSNTTRFMYQDHLGSVRLVTDPNGNVLDSMDFLPFGERIAGTQPWPHEFTGYERDAESNLDNAQARYYSSQMGRFMSPDPYNAGVHEDDPLTWNGYTYVGNNPITLTDPNGLAYQFCLFPGVTGGFRQCGDVATYEDLQAEVGAVDYYLSGTADHGIIKQGSTIVGTYEYYTSDEDSLQAGFQGTQMAAPAVNVAYNGLRLFGFIVAAPAIVAADCLSGSSACTKGNVAFALIPEFGPILKDATLLKMAKSLSESTIYEKAGAFTKATEDFNSLPGTAERRGPVQIKRLTDGSTVVLHDFSSDGRPTLEVQQPADPSVKIRYK